MIKVMVFNTVLSQYTYTVYYMELCHVYVLSLCSQFPCIYTFTYFQCLLNSNIVYQTSAIQSPPFHFQNVTFLLLKLLESDFPQPY